MTSAQKSHFKQSISWIQAVLNVYDMYSALQTAVIKVYCFADCHSNHLIIQLKSGILLAIVAAYSKQGLHKGLSVSSCCNGFKCSRSLIEFPLKRIAEIVNYCQSFWAIKILRPEGKGRYVYVFETCL